MWNAGIPDHVVVLVCWTLDSVDLITKGTENAGNSHNDEWAVNVIDKINLNSSFQFRQSSSCHNTAV